MQVVKEKLGEEVAYHKIEALSASQIKLFNSNRAQFYREVILKDKRKDKDTDSILLGSLIDFILSDCKGDLGLFEQKFDEKFVLSSVKKGTGQQFLLTDLLYDYTINEMDSEGRVTTEFTDRFTRAFENVQKQGKFSKKTIEWALEDFNNSEAKTYFEEKLAATNKKLIDMWMIENAKKRAELVINDENIGYLFQERENIENLGKFVIEWEHKGKVCKSELDNFTIDHNYKELIITEIKSNWDSGNFEWTYLKLRYDLSAVFYTMAVSHWANFGGENEKYKDYKIKFQFLTVDTSQSSLRPLLRPLKPLDLDNAYLGYSINGWYYRGLENLMEEILWCESTNNWNISKEAFDSKSYLPLEINYSN